MDAKLTDVHKEEDEEAERTVAPVTEAEKKAVRGEKRRGVRLTAAGHLKAPYSGLYQQTNEQGVKSRNHSMARPKSTPWEESTQNQARQPNMFTKSVAAWTEEREHLV